MIGCESLSFDQDVILAEGNLTGGELSRKVRPVHKVYLDVVNTGLLQSLIKLLRSLSVTLDHNDIKRLQDLRYLLFRGKWHALRWQVLGKVLS